MDAATLSPLRPPAAPPLPEGAAARATSLLACHERSLRGTARRFAGSPHDAEDAFQRAVEILLTRAPDREPRQLVGWMQVVVRREAIRIRRSRQPPPARVVRARFPEPAIGFADPTADQDGPVEAFERREWVAVRAARLKRLKSDQRQALVLQAAGYSYEEIASMSGWTYSKVNRCIAEGRARLRRLSPCDP